jgi:hypothetical protein
LTAVAIFLCGGPGALGGRGGPIERFGPGKRSSQTRVVSAVRRSDNDHPSHLLVDSAFNPPAIREFRYNPGVETATMNKVAHPN